MRCNQHKRTGVTVVESAVIYPVVVLLIIGLLVGAWGIFRHQELASLARRATRYASVHGAQYERDTNKKAATATDIYDNAIAPHAIGMEKGRLSYTVTWNDSNEQFHATLVNGTLVYTRNTVTVTVNYRWLPEMFFGEINLSSTSVLPMSY